MKSERNTKWLSKMCKSKKDTTKDKDIVTKVKEVLRK
jgi:hypothetical protein